MGTPPARSSPAFVVFLGVAVLLLVFSILSGFSIGLFIIPIPLVMFGSTAAWGRPWIVAGLVTGVIVGSVAYLLTAPLWRFERSSVGIGDADIGAGRSGCSRTILPDVPLAECDDASRQALLLALAGAALVGTGTGLSVRAAVRSWRDGRRSSPDLDRST